MLNPDSVLELYGDLLNTSRVSFKKSKFMKKVISRKESQELIDKTRNNYRL
jgi:hypothetical protein